jgi:predicted nucleotidyltransferase
VSTTPTPTSADLDRIVRFVVEAAQPLRVVLFGSAARGQMHDGSDIDLLVVLPEGADTRAVRKQLYRGMYEQRVDVDQPVQFHATTPSVFEHYKDRFGFIYYDVAREGVELYAA